MFGPTLPQGGLQVLRQEVRLVGLGDGRRRDRHPGRLQGRPLRPHPGKVAGGWLDNFGRLINQTSQ